MHEPTGGASERFIKAANGLAERLEKFDMARPGTTHTTQTTNINAGGWGVLIALILVAFLAGLNIEQASNQAKLAAEMSDLRRRNDLANDKLSVILQWAPELAKKVDQQTKPTKGEAP